MWIISIVRDSRETPFSSLNSGVVKRLRVPWENTANYKGNMISRLAITATKKNRINGNELLQIASIILMKNQNRDRKSLNLTQNN